MDIRVDSSSEIDYRIDKLHDFKQHLKSKQEQIEDNIKNIKLRKQLNDEIDEAFHKIRMEISELESQKSDLEYA